MRCRTAPVLTSPCGLTTTDCSCQNDGLAEVTSKTFLIRRRQAVIPGNCMRNRTKGYPPPTMCPDASHGSSEGGQTTASAGHAQRRVSHVLIAADVSEIVPIGHQRRYYI
jgi:hypothetical protein